MLSIPASSPPLVAPWGIAISDCEKAKALTGSLEIQFELVHDVSEQAVIETFLEGMWAYSSYPSPASELKFTNAAEVEEAIWGIKVGKAPDPNVIPNGHVWDNI